MSIRTMLSYLKIIREGVYLKKKLISFNSLKHLEILLHIADKSYVSRSSLASQFELTPKALEFGLKKLSEGDENKAFDGLELIEGVVFDKNSIDCKNIKLSELGEKFLEEVERRVEKL